MHCKYMSTAMDPGHAIALTISLVRLPTAAERFRSQIRSYGTCCWQIGNRAGFLRVLHVGLKIVIPPTDPYSLIVIFISTLNASLRSKFKSGIEHWNSDIEPDSGMSGWGFEVVSCFDQRLDVFQQEWRNPICNGCGKVKFGSCHQEGHSYMAPPPVLLPISIGHISSFLSPFKISLCFLRRHMRASIGIQTRDYVPQQLPSTKMFLSAD
jgi:hypothetical protein